LESHVFGPDNAKADLREHAATMIWRFDAAEIEHNYSQRKQMINSNESMEKNIDAILRVQFRNALEEFYAAHAQSRTTRKPAPHLKMQGAKSSPRRAATMVGVAVISFALGGMGALMLGLPPLHSAQAGGFQAALVIQTPAKQPALGNPANSPFIDGGMIRPTWNTKEGDKLMFRRTTILFV
jgi:hypothetical protein